MAIIRKYLYYEDSFAVMVALIAKSRWCPYWHLSTAAFLIAFCVWSDCMFLIFWDLGRMEVIRGWFQFEFFEENEYEYTSMASLAWFPCIWSLNIMSGKYWEREVRCNIVGIRGGSYWEIECVEVERMRFAVHLSLRTCPWSSFEDDRLYSGLNGG